MPLVVVVGIAIAIVIFVLLPGLTVGHLLGLTPTLGQFGSQNANWISRHYQNVGLGYTLTGLILLLALPTLVVAIDAWGTLGGPRKFDRRLIFIPLMWVLFVVLAFALPIGPRAHPIGDVPSVLGLSAKTAEARLEGADLTVAFVDQPVVEAACRVTRQSPVAGADVEEYSRVELRCFVRPPRVVGKRLAVAEAQLENVGLTDEVLNEPDSATTCLVTQQSTRKPVRPESSLSLRVKCRVRRALSQPAPASSGATAFSGDPYPGESCAEIGHSYDVVPGTDPEHDADNDGIACEDYPP